MLPDFCSSKIANLLNKILTNYICNKENRIELGVLRQKLSSGSQYNQEHDHKTVCCKNYELWKQKWAQLRVDLKRLQRHKGAGATVNHWKILKLQKVATGSSQQWEYTNSNVLQVNQKNIKSKQNLFTLPYFVACFLLGNCCCCCCCCCCCFLHVVWQHIMRSVFAVLH